MPIEKKKCDCGCGKEFYGTVRRRFYNANHKAHWHRVQKKLKDSVN